MPSSRTRLEPPPDGGGAVLVPVKAFDDAKGRLQPALAEATRSSLARRMATELVRAQRTTNVVVACDDDEVADWADSLGASIAWCPGTGLNGAVQQGFAELRAAHYRWVAVAHSDLPLASSLHPLLGWCGVTLVPDRHRSGTNVIVLPTDIDFRFAYGTDSFARHVTEAVRHRRGLRVVHDARLAWDVDHPDDLDTPEPTFLSDLLESELPA